MRTDHSGKDFTARAAKQGTVAVDATGFNYGEQVRLGSEVRSFCKIQKVSLGNSSYHVSLFICSIL